VRTCATGLSATGRLPALYRQFDVLLLPTVREGMSLALLEAMASGLAVVASEGATATGAAARRGVAQVQAAAAGVAPVRVA